MTLDFGFLSWHKVKGHFSEFLISNILVTSLSAVCTVFSVSHGFFYLYIGYHPFWL